MLNARHNIASQATYQSPPERMTVAAVVPLYNNGQTISEAIESLLAQTRAVDEIIVVDDGSSDGSADMVEQRYGARIRLIRQANGGPSAARNAGIRASRSDLIAFLDADDRWLPERVERQAGFMEAHPDCMFSFTAHFMWHEAQDETRTNNAVIDRRRFLARDFFQERIHISTDSVMVRRQALDEVGLFDESLRQCEDTDLWLRIMLRFGFEHLPEPLAWMRRNTTKQTAVLSRIDEDFVWNERYFLKHRRSFGSGLRGACIWRSAYAFVLRKHAALWVRNGRRDRALSYIGRSLLAWPFPPPVWLAKMAVRLVTCRKNETPPEQATSDGENR